ncbi:ranaspumin-like [Ranitomeya variabilis]|uniref:ranaspumin-like n=1 Tax=Ranitomeya variabilis TaxID=490064 RepID=UPI00405754B2
MKIIVFFALASASICWGLNTSEDNSSPPYPTFRCDNPYINTYSADKSCLQHALEVVPGLVVAGNRLMCKHLWGQMNYRFEFYKDFTNEVKAFLKCAGCSAGGMLGLENELEETGALAGDILAEVFPIIAELIHGAEIFEPLLDVMCYLLSDALTSECLPLITQNANLLVNDLKTLSCQKQKNKLDPETLVAIVGNAGCLTDKLLKTDGLLEPITGTVAVALAPVVSHAADLVLNLPLVGNLVKFLNCFLINLLGGG